MYFIILYCIAQEPREKSLSLEMLALWSRRLESVVRSLLLPPPCQFIFFFINFESIELTFQPAPVHCLPRC